MPTTDAMTVADFAKLVNNLIYTCLEGGVEEGEIDRLEDGVNAAFAARDEQVRRAEAEVARFKDLLQWALVQLLDGRERPVHDCTFFSDPERAECSFCDRCADALDAADMLGVDEDGEALAPAATPAGEVGK